MVEVESVGNRAFHRVQKRLIESGQRSGNGSIIFCSNTLFKRWFCRVILPLSPHLFRDVLVSHSVNFSMEKVRVLKWTLSDQECWGPEFFFQNRLSIANFNVVLNRWGERESTIRQNKRLNEVLAQKNDVTLDTSLTGFSSRFWTRWRALVGSFRVVWVRAFYEIGKPFIGFHSRF